MAMQSGFFDSSEANPKTYNAEQFSKLLDGVITDGIFKLVGGALNVSYKSNMQVNVATGRAWFNGKWLDISNEPEVITIDGGSSTLHRIDTVAIRVDLDAKECKVVIVKGTPTAIYPLPPKPNLSNTAQIKEYPLCHILVGVQASTLSTATFMDARGSSLCPWVTAPVQSISLDDLNPVLTAEFDIWLESMKTSLANYPGGQLAVDIGAITDQLTDYPLEDIVTDVNILKNEPKIILSSTTPTVVNGAIWIKY